jgi:zinc protease
LTAAWAPDYAIAVTTARRLRWAAALWIRGAVLAAGLSACAGTPGNPQSPGYTFHVREYAFPSGLRVVVEEDDTSGVAGAVLVVEAGSVDDPPGKSGLAHTFEHLTFHAPAATGGVLMKTLPRLGAGTFNGETGLDRTTYFAFVPSASLDALVAALIARMAAPTQGIDDALLTREMAVVAEELRMRRGATAHGRALAALVPAGDPYARAFAEKDRPGALTLADVRAFAERSYRPERMTLVISGPGGVDAWDRKLDALLPAALYGRGPRVAPVRRQLASPRPPAVVPAASAPIVKGTVAGPELWMAWPLPPAGERERVRFGVIARVANEMVRLKVASPWPPSTFLGAEVELIAGSQSSLLVARARLRAPADADRARTELGDLIESLSALNLPLVTPPIRHGYTRAVRLTTLQAALAMENLVTRSRVRATAVHEKAGAKFSDVLASIQSITVDDVATVASERLRLAFARAVVLVPDDSSAPQAQAGRSPLRLAALNAEDSRDIEPDVDDADDPQGAAGLPIDAVAWAPGTQRARVTTLANGLTVIVMRRPGLPFVSMLLGFHGEPQPGEAPGVRAALIRTTIWNLQPDTIDRGLFHTTLLQRDSYQEELSMFSTEAGKALELMSEQPERLQVDWPSHRFQRWLESEAQTDAAPPERAHRMFRAALLGEHAYRLTPALDAVRAVTGNDVQSWLERTRRPNNGALVIVGDVDIDELGRLAARRLSDWTGDATPPPPPPGPPVVPAGRRGGPQIIFTADATRRSTEVRFGCLLPPIGDLAADVRSDVLAGVVEDDLYRRLRFRLGASYAPHVAASALRGGTAILEGSFDLEDAALPVALELLRGWLDPTRPTPLTATDFERVRRSQALRSAFHSATNGSVARDLFYAWNHGWPLAALDDFPNALARMTMADVDTALAACRTSAVISVVGMGSPPAVSPASSN